MIAKDMTVGSPTRLLIGFTLPLMVGNLFQQFYNMADSIIVGKGIGVDAFAAVGATGWVSFLILGFVTGLTSGFGILTAQRFGAGDAEGLRHTPDPGDDSIYFYRGHIYNYQHDNLHASAKVSEYSR